MGNCCFIGWFGGPIVKETLKKYIDPLIAEDIGALVLGCTHFPLFIESISELYPDIIVINSAWATAVAVAEAHDGVGSGKTSFLITDGLERFTRVGSYFWGQKPEGIEVVDL